MERDGQFEMFWAEISPCDHSVQIYADDAVFLDTLEGFVAGGLRNGDGVVIIATPPHVSALTERLVASGFDVDQFVRNDQFIVLDVERTLAEFIRNGWPDDTLFHAVIGKILDRARHGGRHVRAFGEMVALLWAQGHSGATVRLEHLWHHLCHDEAFSLFCAYPRSGFTEDVAQSIQRICRTHDRVVGSIH